MLENKIQDNITLTSLSGAYHLTPDSEEDLIVLVHGKAGNRQVMTVFERSFSPQANFIYPEADLPDPLGGFSWWLEAESDAYEFAASKLEKFIDEIIKKFRLKPKRVIACGFSQGGACLSWLSQKRTGFLSHLILICSFYLPRSGEVQSYPQTFIYHGLEDRVVTVEQALAGLNHLVSKQTQVTFVTDSQGHKISSKGLKSLKEWILREL